MIWALFAFVTAFAICLYTLPVLIKVLQQKGLTDLPTEERKVHSTAIPTLGGVIIFAATFFAYGLWLNIDNLNLYYQIRHVLTDSKILLSAAMLIFFVGIKDDLIGTAPEKKIIAHFIAAFILILIGGVRLTGFHGILGVEDIPYWLSFIFSFFVYIGLVNSINLIDGIDGLAGGVSAIFAFCMGIFFGILKDYSLFILSFALCGALAGFLVYNFSPAKIFMGDSGSLSIGLIIYFLSVSFIEYPVTDIPRWFVEYSKPLGALSLLIYPITDTLRVFTIRILQGKSPFMPDKNHLHHHLLNKTQSHAKTSLMIYLFTLVAFAISFLSYIIHPTIVLIILILYALIFIWITTKK
ncbi:MAG: undecaprenyl/decaprenyl-phosphate alpha-N-acetylglucosaminyl 1-phosphate transferase [Bacteroidetes bacterium]|nr:MAG: undecaprenyl/decaprenyl-phosphate alpha-N-acetylglucosaminyl 1-phosphate transferase [Bacteroidota bacterium]